MKTKTYSLKLACAMVILGEVVRAGATVELDEATAKDFLRRGKAEFAGAFDDPEEDTDVGVELSKLNKAKLIELAHHQGILNVHDDMTKAEIVAAIKTAIEDNKVAE